MSSRILSLTDRSGPYDVILCLFVFDVCIVSRVSVFTFQLVQLQHGSKLTHRSTGFSWCSNFRPLLLQVTVHVIVID